MGLFGEKTSKKSANISITLSDISEGMIREVRRSIGRKINVFHTKLLIVIKFLSRMIALTA